MQSRERNWAAIMSTAARLRWRSDLKFEIKKGVEPRTRRGGDLGIAGVRARYVPVPHRDTSPSLGPVLGIFNIRVNHHADRRQDISG